MKPSVISLIALVSLLISTISFANPAAQADAADPNEAVRSQILLAITMAKMPQNITDEDSISETVTKIYKELLRANFCTQESFTETTQVRLCQAELKDLIKSSVESCGLAINEEITSYCAAGREFLKTFEVEGFAEKKCEEGTSKLYEDFCKAGVKAQAATPAHQQKIQGQEFNTDQQHQNLGKSKRAK